MTSWRIKAVLAVLTLIAGYIRLHFLDRTIRYDEAWTYLHYASKSFYFGLANYSAPNNHFLNTALIHVVVRILGNHPWVIRLPAFVAGVLLTPAAYYLGAVFYGEIAGVITAALVAFSPALIEYSDNARGYSMLVLLAIVTFAVARRWISEPRKWHFPTIVLCSAFGFYAVPVMMYPFATMMIWLALGICFRITRPGFGFRQLILLGLSVAAITAVLYLPVLRNGQLIEGMKHSTLAPQSYSDLMQMLPAMPSLYWEFMSFRLPEPARLLLFACCGIALISRRRENRLVQILIVALFIAPVAVTMITHNFPPARVMLYVFPLVFCVAGGGAEIIAGFLRARRVPHWRPVAATALMATLIPIAQNLRTSEDGYFGQNLPDGDKLVSAISRDLTPGDAILAARGLEAPLEYYLDTYNVPFHHIVADVAWIYNAHDRPRRGLPNLECWKRLIVVVSDSDDLQKLLHAAHLEAAHDRHIYWKTTGVTAYSLSRSGDDIESDARNAVLDADFEGQCRCWTFRGSAAVSRATAHNGEAALTIGTGTGGAWQSVPLRRNTKYRFSAWLMPGGIEPVWAGVSLSFPRSPDEKRQCEIRGSGWQQCSFEFRTPPNLDQASVWAWKGESPDRSIVDSFRVEAVY